MRPNVRKSGVLPAVLGKRRLLGAFSLSVSVDGV
jgi:hypothetical protein